MEKKTLGETRLSRGASSPLARRLFIYCLIIVLIKIVNVLMYYISIFILLQFLTLIVLCS